MNWKYLLLLFVVMIGVSACEEESEDPLAITPRKHTESADATISTDFNANTFSSSVETELLQEIKICDPSSKDDSDEKHPSCSPKFFRFFPLTKGKSLKDGFILLVKAGVNGFPLRRVLVFEREKGTLVKINGFNGNLIERRNSTSGHDDLVIRFADNINNNLTYYNCLFQWKQGVYSYKYCEVIDEDVPRKVKSEFIDSMGIEIKKILDRNKMIF